MTFRFGLRFVTNSDRIEFFVIDDEIIEDDSYSNSGSDEDYMSTNIFRTQTYKFDHVQLQKNDWNKIHLSVFPSNVTLYVNCQKHSSFAMKSRPEIDINGEVWFSKFDDDFSTVPVCFS